MFRVKGSLLIRNLTVTVLASLFILVFAAIIVNGNIQSSMQYTESACLDEFRSSVNEFKALLDRYDYMLAGSDSISQYFAADASGRIRVTYEAGIQALLENMAARSGSSADIYLCIRGDKYIYSQNGKENYAAFQQTLARDYDPDQSQLFSGILRCREPVLLSVRHLTDSLYDQLFYLVPVSVTDSHENGVVFLFRHSADSLRALFGSYLGEDYGTLTIYPTQKLSTYYQSGDALLPQNVILRHSGTGALSFREDGTDYELLRVLVNERQMGFSLLNTKTQFFSDTESVKSSQLLFLGIMAFLLLLLSVFISFTNILPIRKYILQLSGSSRLSRNENELEYLKMYHDRLSTENRMLSLRLGQIHVFAASHLVQRLIFGKIRTRDELDYLCSCTGLSLPHPWFCLFYILPGQGPENAEMDDIALSLPEPGGICMLPGELTSENALVVMLNFAAEQEDKTAFLRTLAAGWLGAMKQKGYPDAVIGIGSVVSDALRLPESFAQASVAARLRAPDADRVCFMQPRSASGWQEEQLWPLIVESVRRVQPDQACAYWYALLSALSAAAPSVLLFQYRLHIFLQYFCTQARDTGITVPDQIIESMSLAAGTDELRQLGRQMLLSACDQAARLAEEKQLSQRMTVMQYIRDHFTDYDLSIQSASQVLQLRPAQINDILREDVGMLFVQYIAFLRMEEFKRLLVSGEDAVQDLVHRVGYSDVPSFLRKFKLQEGMTPTEYRHANREKMQNK